MAETSRVLESRRFLKLVYLTILGLISLVIVLLVLIVVENNKLRSEDQETFTQVENELEQLSLDIRTKQDEIEKIKLELNQIQQDDHFSRKELLNRLIDANNDVLVTLDVSFEKIDSLEEIKMDSEMRSSLAELSSFFFLVKESTESAVINAMNERSVIQYLIEIDKALTCYDSINTNESSEAIRTASGKCDEYLQTATSNINVIEADLIMTNRYIESIRQYWEINIQLHSMIEAQDESQATSLRQELNTQESIIKDLKEASVRELDLLLRGEV